MAKKPSKSRITVFIDSDLLERLNDKTKRVGVSKEVLLSSSLPGELAYLSELSSNGPTATKWFRAVGSTKTGKRRINITLDKSVAEKMKRICEEKGLTRDQFITEYINFLLDGDPQGWGAGPLDKVAALLEDPRFEYVQEQGSNPYDDLHMTEDDAEKIGDLLRDLVRGEITQRKQT